MSDSISRQAAIDALHTRFKDGFDGDKWWNSTQVLAAIKGLPSADVPDRKIGKWVRMVDKCDPRFMCSVCKLKEDVPTIMGEPIIWNFCPNCGAMMFDKDTNVRSKGENDGMDNRSE